MLVDTAATLAVFIYVFVTEAANPKTPARFGDWNEQAFTREYYICEIFPSGIAGGVETAAEIYGYPACQYFVSSFDPEVALRLI